VAEGEALPVVEFSLAKLEQLVGSRYDGARLLEELPYIGLDIEGVQDGRVRVEYSPNRPDLGTVYGIARALKGLLGLAKGLHRYTVSAGSVEVIVEEGLEQVRPYIACAVARGVALDDEALRQLIGLQEDLHSGLARRRRLASIGLHRLDPLVPPIRYRPVDGGYRFVPLGQRSEMTLLEVLRELEQGRAYGHLVPAGGPFPILEDSHGQVLSFPPVINGTVTQLEEGVGDIFVDVTGTSRREVEACLNIIATTLAEMGGRLESVTVRHAGREERFPKLEPSRERIDVKLIDGLLGLRLRPETIYGLLERQGMGVELERGEARALIPAYRLDILHPVDLAEEVALAYHFRRIRPQLPKRLGLGKALEWRSFVGKLKEVLVGLGFLEVVTPSLVSKELAGEGALEVEHSKSAEHAFLRTQLLLPLLHALSRNRHEEYPQRIFEVGKVFGRGGEELRLGLAVADSKASYSSISAVIRELNSLLFGEQLSLQTYKGQHLIEGRSALLLLKRRVGCMGEVRPELLERFGLLVPVAYAELSLEAILRPRPEKV
jgi:phenylalanyl-tRNA synthetase beta chain